jgi:hypothetical protein
MKRNLASKTHHEGTRADGVADGNPLLASGVEASWIVSAGVEDLEPRVRCTQCLGGVR